MLRKFLAAAATLLLAAGISVIAVAAPASAHHTDLNRTITCTPDGGWDITWSVTNSENLDATITKSNNASVPQGTKLDANPKYNTAQSKVVTFTQHVMTKAEISLQITVTWSNQQTNDQQLTIRENDFPAGCGDIIVTPVGPDVTKVTECGTVGTVTPKTTVGVVYTTVFDSKTGIYTVTAKPAQGYVFTGNQVVTFTGTTNASYDCVSEPNPVAVVGQCVYQADGTAGQRSMSITFDNSASNKPVLFQVAGQPALDRTVAAGAKATVALPKVDAAGTSYTVTADGKSFTVKADPCPPVVKPAPKTRDASSDTFVCDSQDVTVTTTTWTTDYVFDTAKLEWVEQPEVAGTPVITHRAFTPAETDAHCGVHVTADPTASACNTQPDPATAFTRWIKIDVDPKVAYSAENTVTHVVTPLTAEFTQVDAGKYLVTAVGAPGYVLQPAASRTWPLFVEDSTKCAPPVLPIVTPTYSTTPVSCTTPGSYTIGAVDPGTITWQVNGVTTPAGTYKVATAQDITLVATPTDPADGLDPAWTNPAVLHFTAPSGGCDLPTLAFTGGQTGGLVTLAGAMLVIGLGGLLVARRRWVESK